MAALAVALALTPASAPGAGIGAASAAPPPDPDLPYDGALAFDVFRNGSPIGRHRLSFARSGENAGDLTVRVDIDLVVTFARIPIYRYRHRNTETWRGGDLVSVTTETDDDGTAHFVEAARNRRAVEIESSTGFYQAPLDIIPTSYWDRRIVARTLLLNTQNGKLLRVDVTPLGEERVSVGKMSRAAQRYRVAGDLRLDLWYDDSDELVKLSFTDRTGSDIVYERR